MSANRAHQKPRSGAEPHDLDDRFGLERRRILRFRRPLLARPLLAYNVLCPQIVQLLLQPSHQQPAVLAIEHGVSCIALGQQSAMGIFFNTVIDGRQQLLAVGGQLPAPLRRVNLNAAAARWA